MTVSWILAEDIKLLGQRQRISLFIVQQSAWTSCSCQVPLSCLLPTSHRAMQKAAWWKLHTVGLHHSWGILHFGELECFIMGCTLTRSTFFSGEKHYLCFTGSFNLLLITPLVRKGVSPIQLWGWPNTRDLAVDRWYLQQFIITY